MKQLVEYIAALLLWGCAFVLYFTGTAAWLLAGLAALHFAELILIGYRTGRRYGQSWWHCILSGMLFGYLWWLPLYKRMKYDDLTETDFVEDGKEPWREEW